MDTKYNLKKALFYNDYDRTKNILNSPQFSTDWFVDCGDFPNVPTPIYYIAQLWNEILPGKWPFCQEEVDKQINELNKIISYFESKFQVPASKLLNLSKYKKQVTYYWEYTKYAFDDQKDDVKKFLWETRDELNAKGFRDIDIDLYIAAYKFDCTEVERLLSLGADDTVCFDENDRESCIYACMRDDFDEREDWQTNTLCPNLDYKARKFSKLLVASMFGSAGKQRMVNLFDKYYDQNHPDNQ